MRMILFAVIIMAIPCLVIAQDTIPQTTFTKTLEVNKNTTFEFDGGWWKLDRYGRKDVRVSQCGFYCSLFILQYFDISFNPSLVCESLPMTERGASLAEVQKLLLAHGLVVEGRKNVEFTDLTNIPQQSIAIFAVPVDSGINHYYVVATSREGKTMLVDPPHSAVVIRDMKTSTRKTLSEGLASLNGIVLFITNRPKKLKPLEESVSVSPSERQLGEFLISQEPSPPFRPQFEIKNTSSTPVAVEIQTSCGCVASSNWKSKIVDAKGKAILEFEISPQSWVVGTKTEQVLLKFPDSSSKIISITGTGHGGEGTQTMKLDVPGNCIYCAAAAILPSKMCVVCEGQNCVSSGSVPFDCGDMSIGSCMGTCNRRTPAGTCTGVNLCN